MIIDRFIMLLDKEIEQRKAVLEGGLCPDYVAYRTVVSELKTLLFAVDTAKKVFVEGEDEE